MKDSCAAYIREYSMIDPGDTVVCGVSGGVDSVCLLSLLMELQSELGFTLCAAHYNHCLRGQESDGDEAFVRSLCAGLGIPLLVRRGDVAAASGGVAVEETARKMRYEFFDEALDYFSAQKIATAHNADDNLETLLMHLVRGSGLRGLCGIPPVRGRIIRPLLFAPRSDIEAYCTEKALPHREDSSNSDVKYTRNNLRLRVIPILKELNPKVSESSVDLCRRLREDEALLSSMAQSDEKLPKALAIRKLRLGYEAAGGGNISASHLEALYRLSTGNSPSGTISLPGGITARKSYDRLDFIKTDGSPMPFFHEITPDCHIIQGQFLIICKISEVLPETLNFRNTFAIKSDIIVGGLYARSRHSGDKIRLPGRPEKSLKKLFIDEKVPKHLRDTVPVLADDSGVLGVYGFGCDSRCSQGSGFWLIITISPAEP